jgi:hypothetical protein
LQVATVAAICIAAACGPEAGDEIPKDAAERYAAAMCDAQQRCDCLHEVFDDREQCREVGVSVFEAVADTPDLAFSRKCFESLLTQAAEVPCAPNTPGLGLQCLAFRGTRDLGESCTTDAALFKSWNGSGLSGFLSQGQCKDGGVCEHGRCVAGETAVPIGESCSLGDGRACDVGSYCSRGGICTSLAGPGGPCDAPHGCAGEVASGGPEYYCSGLSLDDPTPGVCVQVVAAGSSCAQTEYESCGYGKVCRSAGSSGQCQDTWPLVCAALRFGPDAYNPFDWIPD